MLCPTTTTREIQRAIYRLQYIYENGNSEILDKYTDLFIAAISHRKHRTIIVDDDYKIDPTTQTLSTNDKIIHFPKQEFDLIYLLRSNRGKSMHREIMQTSILTKDKEPIPYKTLLILAHRINNRLKDVGLGITRTASQTYRFGKSIERKTSGIMPKVIDIDGETIPLSDALKLYNAEYSFVYNRLSNGWSIEEAIKTPKIKPFGRRVA